MIRNLNRLPLVRASRRTYLSSSYKCVSAWEARLGTPTLAINLDQFYADVETKYQQQQRKVSAIDVDIFVNKVTGDSYVDEMADLIHKLRMTEEASNLLDSTAHALVRNLAENDQIDFLRQILRDPLNYGVFLDTFTANLLLDKLVEEGKFTAAAEIASFMMLQEDFGDDISRSLCLLSAFKYLDNPEPFVKVEAAPEPAKNTPAPAPTPKGKKGKKEELRVRVKFLRNEYFDDHFDLKESRHLVGKTLVRLSAESPKKFQASSKLLGLCLYEKYAEAVQFIGELKKEDVIYKECLDRAQQTLEQNVHDSEEYKTLVDSINTVAEKTTIAPEQSFEGEVVALIKSSIASLEKGSIEKQEQVRREEER